jgi:hypothetical protein
MSIADIARTSRPAIMHPAVAKNLSDFEIARIALRDD